MGEITELPNVVSLGFGLLEQWYCVLTEIAPDKLVADIAAHGGFPVTDGALVRDRLHGGFRCEHSERRHVYANMGAYTYMTPTANGPRSPEDRAKDWHRLLQENVPGTAGGFVGGGPFVEDAP